MSFSQRGHGCLFFEATQGASRSPGRQETARRCDCRGRFSCLADYDDIVETENSDVSLRPFDKIPGPDYRDGIHFGHELTPGADEMVRYLVHVGETDQMSNLLVRVEADRVRAAKYDFRVRNERKAHFKTSWIETTASPILLI